MNRVKSALAALTFSAVGFFSSTSVYAADPYVDPAFDWSGAYLGANLGVDIVDFDADVFIPAGSNMNAVARALYGGAGNFSDISTGLLAGLTAGANMQINNFVFGFEGDVSYLFGNPDVSNTFVQGQTSNVTNSLDDGLFATLRARGGLAQGNTLFFLTGGVAYSGSDVGHQMDWTFNDPCPAAAPGFVQCHVGDGGKLGLGWTVGLGIEHAITQTVTVKAEYLYADFKDQDFETISVGFPDQNALHSIDADMHILRVGVNWHF